MHQTIASIIKDGKFQGSFLIEGRQSISIKRGGHNVGSFVFLSHPTEWCRKNLHLPTLLENTCLGEVIVNVRPAWVRRLQRTKAPGKFQPLTPYNYTSATYYPGQMTPRARPPLMTPTVLRPIGVESPHLTTIANKATTAKQRVND